MSLKGKLEGYKNKKELITELNIYKSMIIKKLEEQQFNSALEKARSALTLIVENQDYFNLALELNEFNELNQKIQDELDDHRKIYVRRFKNLLKEKLTESNLENFSKLLAMLKNEVDLYISKYNLYDIRDNINKYFKFIRKLYVIISSYQVLSFHESSKQILEFGSELKNENFPNLKTLTLSIYQKLLNTQFWELAKQYERISLSDLSQRLAIKKESLIEFIALMIQQPQSPIKRFDTNTQIIFFNRQY